MAEEGGQGNTGEADIEAEAREMHWVPKDEYHGDEKDWLPAKEFVERGRQIMPILRENNRRLLDEQRRTQAKVAQLTEELESARGDFETLQEFHNEEVTRRVEETRKELLAQIKAAKREGDVDTEVDLTDQLQRLNSANEEVEVGLEEKGGKNGKVHKAAETQLTPDYLTWKGANTWFESDQERTYDAMAKATRLAKEQPDLRGQAFFTELDKRLNGRTERPKGGKVEGSRGGGSNRRNDGRTYADLDSDAKRQCDKYTEKFVKPNGKFKTAAEYQAHYIRQLEQTGYFE